MGSAERRLAAIMFTDIVGYTRMAQARESLALELLEEHRSLVRPLISARNGTEVKTIGDAFLIEFKSALEAVLCAVDIQKKMGGRNLRVPAERQVRVRVGVHLGDVVHEGGDVYGDAVNVASRIEPLARAGGICISQQVYDNIRNKTDLEIERMGEVELKNVELPVAVYGVNLGGMKGAGEGSSAPRERLAVLPFVNISPDPNDEYFADGLTEELITKLSEVRGLKVIARTSVMNYKKKEKSVSQIGKELEAGTIIEGSIRKAGNKIRVTVQLIDSHTEEHLWASNYDKELDDIFAIQSDVASKVAASVSAGFFPAPKKVDTTDIQAYTIYIKAVQLFHENSEPSLKEAVALFEKAIARDPSFSRAHAGLAVAWIRLASGGYADFKVTETIAEPAARRALELDPGSAEAHAAMASVCYILDRFAQVRSEAEEAVRINPNLAEAHVALGIDNASMGHLARAITSLERAHELDPLAVHVAELLARTYLAAGRNDEAILLMEKMDMLSPMNPRILNGLAESYMVRREFDKATELLSTGLSVNPRESLLRLNLGLVHAFTGRKEEAEKSMADLVAEKNEAVALYARLFIQTALGNLDEAFSALFRMAETHSWPFLVGSLPIFSDLRKDPRYATFAAKVGLPASSASPA